MGRMNRVAAEVTRRILWEDMVSASLPRRLRNSSWEASLLLRMHLDHEPLGRDAFHRVRNLRLKSSDAVERVPTQFMADRFIPLEMFRRWFQLEVDQAVFSRPV